MLSKAPPLSWFESIGRGDVASVGGTPWSSGNLIRCAATAKPNLAPSVRHRTFHRSATIGMPIDYYAEMTLDDLARWMATDRPPAGAPSERELPGIQADSARSLGEVIIAGLNANNLSFVVQGGLLTAALARPDACPGQPEPEDDSRGGGVERASGGRGGAGSEQGCERRGGERKRGRFAPDSPKLGHRSGAPPRSLDHQQFRAVPVQPEVGVVARRPAEAGGGGDAPADADAPAEGAGDSRIPAHLLERSRAAKASRGGADAKSSMISASSVPGSRRWRTPSTCRSTRRSCRSASPSRRSRRRRRNRWGGESTRNGGPGIRGSRSRWGPGGRSGSTRRSAPAVVQTSFDFDASTTSSAFATTPTREY